LKHHMEKKKLTVVVPPSVLAQIERDFGPDAQRMLDDMKKIFENGSPANARVLTQEEFDNDPELQKALEEFEQYEADQAAGRVPPTQ
jgi:hypothetical protein